jgi:hypothetical protein
VRSIVFVTVVAVLCSPNVWGVTLAGDVDGNGSVDAQDIQLVINGALGLPLGNSDGDINGDAAVSAIDVQLVINAVLGLVIDSDGDGLADGREENLGTNPSLFDSDMDTLSDGDEVVVYETDPLIADTDGDGVDDGTEVGASEEPTVANGYIVVNELVASNNAGLQDEDLEFEDWIELFNRSPWPINLAGWALTDNERDPAKWIFPDVTIGSGEYLVVFASGKDRDDPLGPYLHTNYQLRSFGEFLALFNAAGTAAAINRHAPTYPEQLENFSYGLAVNTEERWYFDTPTPGAPNNIGDAFANLDNFLSPSGIRITEYMYTGANGEYVEFTNLGDETVDMAGWSFADENGSPGDFDLSVIGFVAPGDSFIITAEPALTFRDAWFVSNFVPIVGDLGLTMGSNLGCNDEINLYDGTGRAIDRLTYGDENILGSIRANSASGWVTTEGVRLNDISLWTLSNLADAQQSWSSVDGDVGSPGVHRAASFPPPPLASPTVTPSGGMFSEAVEVVLATDEPGAVVRYTFDGSIPTSRSPQYERPLTMASLAGMPNVISEISTTANNDWEPPGGETFKGNVLRARVFKSGEEASATVTHTYFVDNEMMRRYTLPVFSLVTEADNLFDFYTGIYVAGVTDDIGDCLDDEDGCGNYTKRGRAWERPVHAEFFDGHLETKGGDSVSASFRQNMGLRVHGGASRSFPLKSIRLYARAEYEAAKAEYPFFGDNGEMEFLQIVLRNSGTDAYDTYLKDGFVHSIVEGAGGDYLDYRPAIVFINGEYWGIHNMRERHDQDYLALKFGLDGDEIDIMDIFDRIRIDTGDDVAYLELIEFLENNDLSDQAVYDTVAADIEIARQITYAATEIFIDNWDWPENNHKFWRPKDGARGWDWLLFDTDGAFNRSTNQNSIEEMAFDTRFNFIFYSLLQNVNYRDQFASRFADLLNSRFSVDHTTTLLAELRSALEPEWEEHRVRWHAQSQESRDDEIDYIDEWLRDRPERMREHLMDFFDLESTSQLTVSVNNIAAGSVAVNTIPAEEVVMPWTGIYFDGIPVTLEAVPAPGYVFSAWRETGVTTPSTTVVLGENITMTAVFNPIS